MARQHNIPYIVKDANTRALEVAEFRFNEAWLRDFIFMHQQALPVNEIEPVFGSLIPVCTELRTKAGPADILFINDAGLLTLVECKLWKNPEARREVVGQILDYAKELSRWSYDDLQKAVYEKTGKRLYDLVSENSEEFDESEFIDSVSRNLKRGRFLLLVVGDGIRESVELIADFLQQHAHLNFSFALVEMGIFQLPEEFGSGYLVHPRLVTRTLEIERAVIRIEDAKVIAEMPTTEQSLKSLGTSAVAKRTTISEQVFYETLAVDAHTAAELRGFFEAARTIGLDIEPGQNSIKLKLASGGKGFNFGVFNTNGSFQNYGIAATTDAVGHPEIGESYLQKLASLLKGKVYKSPSKFQWTVKKQDDQYFTLRDCIAVRNEWLQLISETVDEILKLQEG